MFNVEAQWYSKEPASPFIISSVCIEQQIQETESPSLYFLQPWKTFVCHCVGWGRRVALWKRRKWQSCFLLPLVLLWLLSAVFLTLLDAFSLQYNPWFSDFLSCPVEWCALSVWKLWGVSAVPDLHQLSLCPQRFQPETLPKPRDPCQLFKQVIYRVFCLLSK